MRYSFDNCPKNEVLTKSKGNFFVLLFVGRTGSSFIIDVFNQHPQTKFEGEWIGTFKDRKDGSGLQTAWIRELYSAENESSFKALGFKTKFYDIPDKNAFRNSLNDFRPTVLLSQRKNILKQAISTIRIKKLAELKRYEMGEEKWQNFRFTNKMWNITRKGDGIGRIQLDLQEVHSMTLVLERSVRELNSFVNSLDLDIITFDYEDLISDTHSFFTKMFYLLGVAPISYKTRFFKHTPDELPEAIENFRELQAFYAGTRHEKFVV
jgi:hypothetical protein